MGVWGEKGMFGLGHELWRGVWECRVMVEAGLKRSCRERYIVIDDCISTF